MPLVSVSVTTTFSGILNTRTWSCGRSTASSITFRTLWAIITPLFSCVVISIVNPLVLCMCCSWWVRWRRYELISKRKVDSSNPDLNHDPLHILPHSSELVHMIPFLSAYKSFFGTEPKYTNYTGMWWTCLLMLLGNYQGCLDYIWFTSQPAINSGVGLHLVGASPMPSEELLRSHRDLYLPNPQYPSDHLPLIAKFELFIQG